MVVRVLRADGELRVDLRVLDSHGRYTKTGVWMAIQNWYELHERADHIDKALDERASLELHLKDKLYVSVNPLYRGVDLRQYHVKINPSTGIEEKRATRRGVFMSPELWTQFRAQFSSLSGLMELPYFQPCYLQNDHLNEVSWLSCASCNPALPAPWNAAN